VDELTCIDGPQGCVGAVELRPSPPMGERSFARCEAHQERRWARFEGSLEQEALSPSPPAWFDPMDAGERWDDE